MKMQKAERLFDALGQIDEHYLTDILPEQQRTLLRPAPRMRRFALLAAVLALLAVLSAAAYAANRLGLHMYLLPRDTYDVSSSISLAGYCGSPEWQAQAEWQAYLCSVAMAETSFSPPDGQLETSLAAYSCYQITSPENAAQLEEIADRYGLQLHTAFYDLQARPELKKTLGSFFESTGGLYTWVYEDGTFQLEGTAQLGEIGAWDYTLLRAVRGSFHDCLLDIGIPEDYQEISYESACGVTVALALSADRALLFADLPDSLVTVYLPFGTKAGLRQCHLQQLADSIDFSALTPAIAPQLDVIFPDENASKTNQSYAAALRNLLYNGIFPDGRTAFLPLSPSDCFAIADIDGDGQEELILLTAGGSDVFGCNAASDGLYLELHESRELCFLQNGSLKALDSHNQTGSDFWPFTLYQYVPESDSYQQAGHIHAEDDASGRVYFIGTDGWGETPIDENALLSWLSAHQGDADALKLSPLPLTAENIAALE